MNRNEIALPIFLKLMELAVHKGARLSDDRVIDEAFKMSDAFMARGARK